MHTTRPRILVVDDDPSILSVLGTVAEREGFAVTAATNGADALRHLRESPTDLGLVDLPVGLS